MVDGIAAFVTGLSTNPFGALVPAVMILFLVIGGITYMTGNHMEGKRIMIGSIIGGVVSMLAVPISTAARALAHA